MLAEATTTSPTRTVAAALVQKVTVVEAKLPEVEAIDWSMTTEAEAHPTQRVVELATRAIAPPWQPTPPVETKDMSRKAANTPAKGAPGG